MADLMIAVINFQQKSVALCPIEYHNRSAILVWGLRNKNKNKIKNIAQR